MARYPCPLDASPLPETGDPHGLRGGINKDERRVPLDEPVVDEEVRMARELVNDDGGPGDNEHATPDEKAVVPVVGPAGSRPEWQAND